MRHQDTFQHNRVKTKVIKTKVMEYCSGVGQRGKTTFVCFDGRIIIHPKSIIECPRCHKLLRRNKNNLIVKSHGIYIKI